MDSGNPKDGIKLSDNNTVRSAQSDIEKEILRWNWGAFLLGWIWAVGNRLWIWFPIGLAANAVSFLPLPNNKAVYISMICQGVISVVLGIKGSEWAWKSKKQDSLERFKKTQETWRKWGVVFTIAAFIAGLVLGYNSP